MTRDAMLRTTGLVFLIGLLLVLASACAEPDSRDDTEAPTYALGDSITVTGVLIDTRCFHLDKATNHAVDHNRPEPEGHVLGCARACALQGFPVGVLEGGASDGKVWILSFTSQVFADYMAQTVRVNGEFRSDGIIVPLQVEMQTSDGWTRIM